jgi:UDP-N-acetylmuramate: L-alanyl-gamma-D-glutamyl-meso-diaminopimelate ligase
MNLDNMLLGADLARFKDKTKKIFFYRICGTGMGACACLAKEAGFEVAGADMTFSPPMSTYLETLDIPLSKLSDLTVQILNEYDLIVVGNSVPRTSEYARFVEESGVPFTSFPSFMGEFILKDREVIGLSGTHGKTTTTYFLTQMLESLGEEPGYFIGGIIDGRPPSKLGTSKYFTIESDEYDSAYFQKISKFRVYEMNHLVITSLEFDHADIFNSIEDIKNEFASTIPSLNGEIIVNNEYKAIFDLKDKYDAKDTWQVYGHDSKLGPLSIESTSELTKFKVQLNNKLLDFSTNIIGKHNILNITSCILLLEKLGFSSEKIQSSVANLGLVKRRQEVRGEYHGAIVIDDFAHHPRAIELTTQAIKARFPNKKIISIFEPISATARSQVFQKEFEDSLKLSDKVVLAVNTLQTTVGGNNLDCSLIAKNLSEFGVEAMCAENLSELENQINKYADENSLLLIMSNRTCLGLWESDFVKNIS